MKQRIIDDRIKKQQDEAKHKSQRLQEIHDHYVSKYLDDPSEDEEPQVNFYVDNRVMKPLWAEGAD